MFKRILNSLRKLFVLPESEFVENEFHQNLAWKKDRVRLMIQGRIL